MKVKESKMKPKQTQKEEKKYPTPDGGYIKKMEDGWYKAFREDDTEITGVTLPINICLMAIRGLLPPFVKIYPAEEDIAMEPSLKILRDRFMEDSSF
jgi:hypothetical protein